MMSSGAIRIVIFGAPGSGKGSQSKLLSERLGLVHISTGDILRDAVKSGSELGKKVQTIIDAGNLVSDDLVTELVRERLGRFSEKDSFILDGFPRNISQTKSLDEMLIKSGIPINKVIKLDVPEEVILERIKGRFAEGGALRADDDIKIARKRQRIYQSEVVPIVDYYRSKPVFSAVNGVGKLEDVYERILKVLP